MARILIFVDHEIIIRHFIQSGVLKPLHALHDVLYVFPIHKRVTTDLDSLDLPRYRRIPISNERNDHWQHLYQAATLMRARRSKDKSSIFEFWRESLGWRPFFKSWLASWPWTHPFYKRLMLRRIGQDPHFEGLLREERPDIVLHPTVLAGLFVSDLTDWARRHETPVVFLMNSWDNPSMKAMTMGYPDLLVVWGEQTRQHAIRHLGIPADHIRSFGAAQFDLYKNPSREERSPFLKRLGLLETKKTLLYAGSSKGLNEVKHLQMLEEAIQNRELPNCQVIYRPHPWRGVVKGEPDFFALSWNHVTMDPSMADFYHANKKGENRIFKADYQQTHSLLTAIDALVSPISTILLEAALHGKPVLAYLPEEEIVDDYFIRTMANMNFMKDFYERFDCGPCLRNDQFIPACRALLDSTENPRLSDHIKKQTSYFLEDSRRSYSEQLQDLIQECTKNSNGDSHIHEPIALIH